MLDIFPLDGICGHCLHVYTITKLIFKSMNQVQCIEFVLKVIIEIL